MESEKPIPGGHEETPSQVAGLEASPTTPELDIMALPQMPLNMLTQEDKELDVPGLVNRLAVLSDEETDLFSEHFEEYRNAGIGREAAAFLAYRKLKGEAS